MNGIRIWLTAALAAIALAACAGDDVDSLMERAAEEREEGLYESATADYRSVLEREPDNAEARFGLGEVALKSGNAADAEEQLRRAAELGIEPARVQPLLAEALLQQNEPGEVLRVAQPEDISDEAAKVLLLTAIGEAHLQARRPSEAAQSVDQALEIDPDSVPALVVRARLAAGTGEPEAAEEYIAQALELDGQSAAAWFFRGDLSRAQGRTDEAIEAYQEVVELGPRDISPQEVFTARGRLAESLMGAGRHEDATEHVETMLQQGARHPYANYVGGLHAYAEEDWVTANERLQIVLSRAPNNLQAKALQGAVKMRQEQYAQAVTLLAEVVSAQPENVRSRLMLAAALREDGAADRAAEVLAEGIRYSAENPEALATFGRAAGDDVEEVIASLGRAAQSNPEARQAQLGFARALMEQGNFDPALGMLQQPDLAEGDNELLRRQFLAVAALRSGDAETAVAEAEKMVDDYPDSSPAHNVAGGVYMGLERFDEAHAAFEAAREIDPDSTQTTLNLGLLAIAEGNLDEAAEYLERGLEADADNTAAMLALGQVEQRRGDAERAQHWYERAAETAPDDPRPLVGLARLHFQAENIEAALDAAEQAVELAPRSPVTLNLLGAAQLAADRPEDAVASFEQAAERAPYSAQIRTTLARAQLAAGDDEAALQTMEALYSERPDLLSAGFTLGRLQLRADDPEAALATAERLQEEEGGTGIGALLEGHAERAADRVDAAIEAYQRALDAGERDALGPLVANRDEAGVSDPEQPLLDWLEEHPDDHAARVSLAHWYGERADHDRAAAQYEALIEAASRPNAALLNNLAWSYHEAGDDRALETAREAHELAPDDPAIADTLGWIEFRAGNAEQARELLASAVEGAPDRPEIRYHYAAALAENGDRDEAREQLDQALAGDADFAARADAEALRESLANR